MSSSQKQTLTDVSKFPDEKFYAPKLSQTGHCTSVRYSFAFWLDDECYSDVSPTDRPS